MPANLVEKILKCHVREGLPGRSREIGIRIDQAWIQGAVGTQAGLAEPFPGAGNAVPWLDEQANLRKEKNFFETRVTEYQTGGSLAWD
jgi:ribonucleoside-diphosphate reductase beta chain